MIWWQICGWITVTLAATGCVFQALAALAVSRFFADSPPAGGKHAAITLLKPLYGNEPRLVENLTTFLAQDYAAPIQMVCGVNAPDDACVNAVATLRGARPDADIVLTIARTVVPSGARARNGKIGNLIAMLPAATHEVLVLSDSDMVVAPDYLARVTAALARPGVGAVSCLYVGRGDGGWWSRLGAAMIDWQAMPNMVVGLTTGLAHPCMGSTIAMRRATLDAIGGFARFADVLADDHAIGGAVTAQGLAVSVPPMLVVHAGDEAGLGELWRHHLRWAVTIRGLAGAGHYGSLVTHALPLALLAAPFHPAIGLALAGTALALRLAVARAVARAARDLPGRIEPSLWLLPVADCMGLAVFLASLMARRIDWRGAALTMEPDGRIAASSTRDS